MNESKFGGSLNLTLARAGFKASNVTRPAITLLPTYNRFSINSLGSKAMGLQHGDTVSFLVNEEAEDVNNMFFICKGIEGNEALLSSVKGRKGTGLTLNFNFAGIYARMLQMDTDAMEVSPERLAELGLVEKRITEQENVAYSSRKKIEFALVSQGELNIGTEEEPVAREIFALTEVKEIEYDPKTSEE
jgi:hypothetical protein